MKKTALPYFPFGFTTFGDKTVCAGLKTDNKIYLAVWNLKGEGSIFIPISEKIVDAKIAYPSNTSTFLCANDRGIDVICPKSPCAVFLEITI